MDVKYRISDIVIGSEQSQEQRRSASDVNGSSSQCESVAQVSMIQYGKKVKKTFKARRKARSYPRG